MTGADTSSLTHVPCSTVGCATKKHYGFKPYILRILNVSWNFSLNVIDVTHFNRVLDILDIPHIPCLKRMPKPWTSCTLEWCSGCGRCNRYTWCSGSLELLPGFDCMDMAFAKMHVAQVPPKATLVHCKATRMPAKDAWEGTDFDQAAPAPLLRRLYCS